MSREPAKEDGVETGVIVDLKYGKKKVKTEGNPQLSYYAVALKKQSRKHLERVKVRIVQPRIEHFYSEVWYTRAELDEWEEKLKAGAEKAIRQAGGLEPRELNAGSWCYWCRARMVCPEKKRLADEKAVGVFSVFEEVTG